MWPNKKWINFFERGKKQFQLSEERKGSDVISTFFLKTKLFFRSLEMTQEDEKYRHLEICLIIEKRWLE